MSNEESLYIGNVLHDNVYVGTYNEERVLIKEYLTNHLSEKEKNHMKTEIDQLSKLNNRYLVHYLGKIERKSKTLIILEDCPGSSLREYIDDVKNVDRLFEEHTVKRVLMNLCSGLQYLHTERINEETNEKYTIIHRDLRPENISISLGGEFIIGDLGLIKSRKNLENISMDQTIVDIKKESDNNCYIAPEQMTSNYDSKVDMWSLGCIIYEMCTLTCPFNESKLSKLCLNPGSLNLPEMEGYSKELNDIVLNHLIVFDSNKRYSSEELLNIDYLHNYIKEKEKMPANINILIDTPDREIISPIKAVRKSYRNIKKVEFNDDDDNNDDNNDDRESRIIHNSDIPPCPEDDTSDAEEEDDGNDGNDGNKKKNNTTGNDLTSTVFYFKPVTETMIISSHATNILTEVTVELVYMNQIASKPNSDLINSILNSTSNSWLNPIENRNWFFPIDKSENGEPYFHNKSEINAFLYNKEFYRMFNVLSEKLLNYYGYCTVMTKHPVGIGYLNQQRISEWSYNICEIKFLARFLKCLHTLNHEYFGGLYNRLNQDFLRLIDDGKTIFRENFLDIIKGDDRYKTMYNLAVLMTG